jgi:hypothetical protein
MIYKVMAKLFAGWREFDVKDELVVTNDVMFPWEYNPHNVRPWLVVTSIGVLGLVWGSCEGDALDTLIDEDLGDSLILSEEDVKEWCADGREDEICYAGNAGEPVDLTEVYICEVILRPAEDIELIVALAEARGAG